MKNAFFTLLFLFVSALTFASADTNIKKAETTPLATVEDQNHKFNAMRSSENLADCTITVKNNKTGDSYTITVHGKSCSELVKEIMKK